VGKDQRTAKQQYQMRTTSKFKGENFENKPIPQIDDELINIKEKTDELKVPKKVGCKKCKKVKKQVDKLRTYAKKRRGVRIKKDATDKLIDDVLKMK